jgi:hypothetical protein
LRVGIRTCKQALIVYKPGRLDAHGLRSVPDNVDGEESTKANTACNPSVRAQDAGAHMRDMTAYSKLTAVPAEGPLPSFCVVELEKRITNITREATRLSLEWLSARLRCADVRTTRGRTDD